MKRLIVGILCVAVVLMVAATQYQLVANQIHKRTVKVGIIDSIVSNKSLRYYDVEQTKRFISVSDDSQEYHGDAILNIIKKNSTGIKIYYAQVLNDNNVGQVTNIVNSINWCINNKVDIINMSFSTTEDNELLRLAISNAISKNIIIVAACFNHVGVDSYPAMYNGVVSVSNGDIEDATVIVRHGEYVLNLPDIGKRSYNGTSYITADITANVSKILHENDFDIEKTIEEIKTKYSK